MTFRTMSNRSELERRPRLCVVGPLIGRNPGLTTTPGEFLSDRFHERGFSVISVSAFANRYQRLADIVSTVFRHRRNIDIMVIQVYGGRSFVVEDIVSWLGKRFGHRVVMFLHGGWLPGLFRRFPRWTRRVLARADALVVPSEFLGRAVSASGFRARVIPNALDLSAYHYRHRARVSPRLFWMRAFYADYNPLMAVRVLAGLRSECTEASLVMAGRYGEAEVGVRQLAKDLGVASAVRLAGFLDVAGKAREGDAADIFINTSIVDNMPVAVLEACAMGLPVIATNVGGVPDLLTDGETGLLVPDGDSSAMVRAVLRVLREPGLGARLSAKGRELAERFSWDEVWPLWEDLFAEVMSRGLKG